MKFKYNLSHVGNWSVMRNDVQAAASSVVAFMVAGVIFVGSVGALLVVSRDSGDVSNSPSAAAALSLQSQALADLVVASPGFHLDLNGNFVEDWDTGSADELGRLGLRATDSAMMDFDKFQNLRRAGYAATDDGLVNYPDARASLGLDDVGLDFHLRAFPSLKSVREILANGERDPNLRVAYIGDVEAVSHGGTSSDPAAGLVVGELTCTVLTDAYLFELPVTNGGTSATQFSGFFEVEWTGSTDDYEDRARTSLVPAGDTAVLALKVPNTSGRTCNTGQVEVEVWDTSAKLWEHEFNLPLATSGTAATTHTHDLMVNPGRSYYLPGENVVIDFDGDLPTKTSDGTVYLTLELKSGATTLLTTLVNVTKNVRSMTLDDSRFTSGNDFTVDLTYPSGGVTVTDTILVANTLAAPLAYAPTGATITYDPQAPVAPEVGFLEDLVDKFCPAYFNKEAEGPLPVIDLNKNDVLEPVAPKMTPVDTYADRCGFDRFLNPHDGDVYPDTRDVLNNDLPERLIDASAVQAPANPDGYTPQCNGNLVGAPRYDWTRVLVVGSNVDHNSMTSADAKYAVCEWVMGGGTLIVFGSADQQVQWLQPIFHAAITSSSTAVSTPDASHPILNRADALAYDGYDERGQVWSFNGPTAANQAALLTNVVAAGADTTLSISNPGAFGDGNIILTTWLPYDLFGGGTSELEGLKVVNNFLMQGYRDLFLDYGPEIPASGRQAAAAQRVVDIIHPDFTRPLTGGTCSNPQLIAYDSLGAPKACYEPITLTLFVYVF